MKQKLMDLYFTEGADLTNRQPWLTRAAADVGLDAKDDPKRRWPVTRTLPKSSAKHLSAKEAGIEGVPCFILRWKICDLGRAGAGISR